jgi:hypothetical protein
MAIAGGAPENSHFEASLDELGKDTGAEEASLEVSAFVT